MANNYLLLILATMLAVSAAENQKCSSTSRYIEINLSSVQNETGDWDISVDLERSISPRATKELRVNVKHGTGLCGKDETEHFTVAASLNHQQGVTPPAVTEETIGNKTTDVSPLTTQQMSDETTTSTSAPPPAGYQLFADRGWYKVYKERKAWNTARAQCKNDGGDLVVSDFDAGWGKIYKQLPSWQADTAYWVGVHEPDYNGTWITVHGEPVSSGWWYPGQPIGLGAHCGLVVSVGLLHSGICEISRYFICKIAE